MKKPRSSPWTAGLTSSGPSRRVLIDSTGAGTLSRPQPAARREVYPIVRLVLAAAAATALIGAAPASAWTPQRLFSGGDFFQQTVELAQNSRGDAAVVFEDLRAVRLATARPGHRFSRPRRVPGSRGGQNARVAIDEQGDVLVAWEYFDHTS